MSLINYLSQSSFITIFVLTWLSAYFIAVFWISFYKFFSLNNMIYKEKESLEHMFTGSFSVREDSVLKRCVQSDIKKEFLEVCKGTAISKATSGLSILSIVASTSPFIGLFGTVVAILETFSKLGNTASLSIIAPAISEALVATAAGILVAIPAYTFYILLQRKAKEYSVVLDRQINVMLSRKA
jgi:biopolymer transport protein ExbB/TolQ